MQLTRSFTGGESLEKGQVAAQFAERVGGIEIVAGVREGLEMYRVRLRVLKKSSVVIPGVGAPVRNRGDAGGLQKNQSWRTASVRCSSACSPTNARKSQAGRR